LPGINSQWLSPLLINTPLAPKDTEIYVENLQEQPYIRMTLGWLKRVGLEYREENMETFYLKGGQRPKSFDYEIPSDWESACFPIIGAAITDSDITLYGLDTNDYQGDKVVIDILKDMGADIEVKNNGKDGIRIKGGKTLRGIEIDCSDIPDAPPILAILGTQAEGKTVLKNLGASRLKETDRAKTIAEELRKMGAKIEEYEDSMVIYKSDLYGAKINGHTDHRIVMATAIAGLVAKGNTIIDDAEYVSVSFPNFYEVMTSLGAKMEKVKEIK
ncbi:MAG TPA: 3-phosphoshikimate 1-carboxyvinyltransferase, partial [Candidatus Atribacteria bacterium]|nr:3-phosphoshikimate 1-carboxyvinyltransferase [Candidatus Atribacteria bacterium]